MKVVTAPKEYTPFDSEISVFLAGGITNCSNWQEDIINRLRESLYADRLSSGLIVYNPRRENFPIDNPNAAYEQIEWEYNQLSNMDIFSMYFCEGDSDQPICMYELGRYIAKMQSSFPIDWERRIIISVEQGYKRKQDVLVQTSLACGNKVHVETQVSKDVLRDYHTTYIINAYKHLKGAF